MAEAAGARRNVAGHCAKELKAGRQAHKTQRALEGVTRQSQEAPVAQYLVFREHITHLDLLIVAGAEGKTPPHETIKEAQIKVAASPLAEAPQVQAPLRATLPRPEAAQGCEPEARS